MKTISKNKWYKFLKIITILALAAYVIKNMLVGMDVDEEYGVVVGYRLAMGDKLLLQMWEPHQTSAVFTAILEKPMLILMGGKADFLDLYLKAVYFVIHTLITVFIYKTLRKCIPQLEKNAAILTALVFFVTSPKSIYVPEYSNLHVWFFALLAMTLVRYYSHPKEKTAGIVWLILAGCCITGDVMSYPATVLLMPLCLIFILRRHEKKAAVEIAAFVLPCVISFAIFCGYLMSYMTPSQTIEMIKYTISDGSHQLHYADKLWSIFSEFGIMALIIGASILAAYAAVALYCRRTKSKEPISKEDRTAIAVLIVMSIQLVVELICLFNSKYSGYYPQLIYIAVSVLGIMLYLKSDRQEKTGFYLILFSIAGYICVLLMSNWGPLNLNCYMFMGAVGGFICMYGYFRGVNLKTKVNAVYAVCLLTILCNIFGYCYLIIGGEDAHSTIFSVGGYGKGGVKAGIIGSWMSSHRYNTNLEMWDEMIPAGSRLLYVGQSQCFYMMGDCIIASPNTISTPEWDEKLLEYWELNPDRYPDVIAFESWYGDVWYSEDNYVMQWVESEFGYTRMEEYPYVTVYYK